MSFLDSLGSSQTPTQGGFMGSIGGSQTSPPPPQTPPQNLAQSLWNGLVGGAKAIASPAVTIAARPLQAASDLGDYLGTRIEENKATDSGQKSAILSAEQQRATQNQTQSSLGGFVAPTPANAADVKKDVGRGAETVALGLGPTAGGALFGAGNSLEQGNDLLSPETAVQTVAGLAGGKILGLVGKPIFNALGKVVAKITPDFLQNIASKGTSAITDFAAQHNLLPENVSHVINASADVADTAANKPFNATVDAAGALQDKAQISLAKGNLGTQTQTSAERLAQQAPLQGAGAARQAKPIDVYNEFANQESKHLADIKQDPAISTVGSRIGDAFNQVVKQRQAVGKTMASELDKVATEPVNLGSALSKFQSELLDNGAHFDSVDKQVIGGSASKFTEQDKTILNKYASDLQSLGNKPTVQQLDAFIGRMPNEIKGLKASSGINFKTNAERLITKSLGNLRDSLGESATPAYNTARKQYADLSGFVKEGAPMLGKITQSGDFAKDASLAKSAVQSVLNNGKKDFLIKLEQHTGYPALDEATLALQAMKDAGDYKGNSLLDLMTKGGQEIPTTKSGLVDRILGFGVDKGKQIIAGSPAEQTRAYLKSLEKGVH